MFNKLSWTAQLFAGTTLFCISFLLEASVLSDYLDNVGLAYALAAALETSKALTVVLYRLLRNQTEVHYPLTVRSMVLSFRVLLLLLSTVCSLLYVAQKLDRPNLESVRQADLEQLDRRRAEALERIDHDHQQSRDAGLNELEIRYAQTNQLTDARYRPDIEALEQALDREMDNVVKSVFKGPRYQEFERRISEQRQAYQAALDRIRSDRATDAEQVLAQLSQRRQQQTAQTAREYRSARQALLHADYVGDARVEHPMVRAFLGVVNQVLGLEINALHFVLYFGLFLSLTIELGILVAFENLTLARLPVYDAEHRTDVAMKKKAIRSQEELEAFRLDDDLVRAKAEKRRQRVEGELDDYLDGIREAS